MRRFWFEFDLTDWPDYPAGTQLGCGVTAYDLDDAMSFVTKVFTGFPAPKVRRVTADIDVSTLDERHILPSMGNVLRRGVWFPLGYELTRW